MILADYGTRSIKKPVLLTGGVEPGVVEKILGPGEARPVGEKKEFRGDERRGVLAVRRDDIGDALPARSRSGDALRF